MVRHSGSGPRLPNYCKSIPQKMYSCDAGCSMHRRHSQSSVLLLIRPAHRSFIPISILPLTYRSPKENKATTIRTIQAQARPCNHSTAMSESLNFIKCDRAIQDTLYRRYISVTKINASAARARLKSAAAPSSPLTGCQGAHRGCTTACHKTRSIADVTRRNGLMQTAQSVHVDSLYI